MTSNQSAKTKYPPEFKDKAVSLVLDDGLTCYAAAKQVGAYQATLLQWLVDHLMKEREGSPSGLSMDELVKLQVENDRLLDENEELTDKNEILQAGTEAYAEMLKGKAKEVKELQEANHRLQAKCERLRWAATKLITDDEFHSDLLHQKEDETSSSMPVC